MITPEWRKRFTVLSSRLNCHTPSIECEFALQKFKELRNIHETDSSQTQHVVTLDQGPGIDYDEFAQRAIEKGLDAAILGAAWLEK